jgi:hypothetical protein
MMRHARWWFVVSLLVATALAEGLQRGTGSSRSLGFLAVFGATYCTFLLHANGSQLYNSVLQQSSKGELARSAVLFGASSVVGICIAILPSEGAATIVLWIIALVPIVSYFSLWTLAQRSTDETSDA